jgi:hypothetical protein
MLKTIPFVSNRIFSAFLKSGFVTWQLGGLTQGHRRIF